MEVTPAQGGGGGGDGGEVVEMGVEMGVTWWGWGQEVGGGGRELGRGGEEE